MWYFFQGWLVVVNVNRDSSLVNGLLHLIPWRPRGSPENPDTVYKSQRLNAWKGFSKLHFWIKV